MITVTIEPDGTRVLAMPKWTAVERLTEEEARALARALFWGTSEMQWTLEDVIREYMATVLTPEQVEEFRRQMFAEPGTSNPGLPTV